MSIRSQTIRLRKSIAFVGSLSLLVLMEASCSRHNDATPAEARGKGRVTIVYQNEAILPENRDAIKKIRGSGVFEPMADRLTNACLPRRSLATAGRRRVIDDLRAISEPLSR